MLRIEKKVFLSLFFVLFLVNFSFAEDNSKKKAHVVYSDSGDKTIYTLEAVDGSIKLVMNPYGGVAEKVFINGDWNRTKQDILVNDRENQFKSFDFVLGTYTDLITSTKRPGYKVIQDAPNTIDLFAEAKVDGHKIAIQRTLTLHQEGQVLEALSLVNESDSTVSLDFQGLAFSFASLFDLSRASASTNNIPEFKYYKDDKLTKVAINGGSFFSGPKPMEFIHRPRWFTISDNFFLVVVDVHTDDIVVVYNGLNFGSKYRVSMGIQRLATEIQAKQNIVFSVHYYVGPRNENIVRHINRDFTKLFRWPLVFNWILKPIELGTTKVIHFLIQVTGSVGFTLILIAILVKLFLLPMSVRSAISMKKMRLLQPKLNKIQSKYGDNPQLVQQKTLELYKEKKVNPLGGCLPLLAQIPVFFALFRVLSRSIALRGAGFLWIKDLTLPDAFFNIGSFQINILPVLMTILQILSVYLQQSRVGTVQNGTQQQMQKQSYFMSVIFLFLFWNMPAGLVLYWTVQNIFSILEQEVINFDSRLTKEIS